MSVDFLAHTRREERLPQQLGGVAADEGQHGPEGSNQASKDRLGALVPDAARLWPPAPLQVVVLPEGTSCSPPESGSKTLVATGRGKGASAHGCLDQGPAAENPKSFFNGAVVVQLVSATASLARGFQYGP